jgi:hypothetical protein
MTVRQDVFSWNRWLNVFLSMHNYNNYWYIIMIAEVKGLGPMVSMVKIDLGGPTKDGAVSQRIMDRTSIGLPWRWTLCKRYNRTG